MRNPALHLVGIAASPGGGGLFYTRAEEELRQWLEQRLDALGIDPVAYSRFVLSFLRRPDSALTPPLNALSSSKHSGTSGHRSRTRPRTKLPIQGDKEQRRAVVQCLKSAAEQKGGVESLVDELCVKLKNLEGGYSKDQQEELPTPSDGEAKVPVETLTPHDRALRYYAAFPALQPVTTKKFSHWKERNINNNNSNSSNNNNIISTNNNYCYHNNTNINNKNKKNNKKNIGINKTNKNHTNKTHKKNNKFSLASTEEHQLDEVNFGFSILMEQEKKIEHEPTLDELRLAQLQAKFDESLEALWDSGPGMSQGSDSIWAAPSLSIPSGPSWPVENVVNKSFASNISENNIIESPVYEELHIDDSPLISWDVDLFKVEDSSDKSSTKNSTQIDACWSNSIESDDDLQYRFCDRVTVNKSSTKNSTQIDACWSNSIESDDDLLHRFSDRVTVNKSSNENSTQIDACLSNSIEDDDLLYLRFSDRVTVNKSSNENKIDACLSNSIEDEDLLYLRFCNNRVTVNKSSNENSTQIDACLSNSISIDEDCSLYLRFCDSRKISCFFPVIPWKTPITVKTESSLQQKITSLPKPDEDLFTSARTHFRPIKDDGYWADGTTFSVNTSLERVAYRRSDSGHFLYLPGGNSPYMEYKENSSKPIADTPNLTLKFRVHQCDKSIQTEPIRSPVKRRIIPEQEPNNCLYYSPDPNGEINLNSNDEITKHYYDLERQANWDQQSITILRNERKRRHSSSFKAQPLAILRPLTL